MDDDQEEERYAKRRANYLERHLDVRDVEAQAIAWSEMGYTDSAIAKKMDSTKGTVSNWQERVAVEYGQEVLFPQVREERGDYERLDDEDVLELPRERREWYYGLVESHTDRAPEFARSLVNMDSETIEEVDAN
ncbi:hypothetical protein [Halobacterium hubeiense]|uniref:hypothetical protein n=1 Tax=Halobacterium hubeiense TaxID=1407499 RepID=UPI003C7131FC